MSNSHLPHPANPKGSQLRKLTLGAVGVVFGDIGTSPLYTVHETLMHAPHLTIENIVGVISLILWSLIIVVSIKYVMFVMRADNRGEGGILALMAMAQRALHRKPLLITALGIIGAALFYGDGIITPAISVLSAVEGLKVATPFFDPYIVPISIGVLIVLFGFQQHGSERIGQFFGPIMCVWFISIGALGVYQIMQTPIILTAFNPLSGLHFFVVNSRVGFFLLGTVVLCVTGAEALYADMGHFGFLPIRHAWLYFVMPCLMLNYMGQGALLIHMPEAIENPFYKMLPAFGIYPMVILSTVATVIASQALISGAYSMTQQAIQLDFIPRFKITHTSSIHMGQIYMPKLNLLLFIGVVLLILWFHSSSALAGAYGIAVTGTMLITSTLAFIVAWKLWHWPLWKTLLLLVPLWLVDAAFFSATLMKLSNGIGAWIPLMLGLLIFTIMLTWYQGKIIKNKRVAQGRGRLDKFITNLDDKKIQRVNGTAIYMTRDVDHVPPALSVNLKHYKAIHEQVLLVKVDTLNVPRVPEAERMVVQQLGKGFVTISLFYGFMQQPNIPRALSHLHQFGVKTDMKEATYFMTRVRVVATPGSGMWLWREKMYATMHRNASEASDFFHLPANRVIETGSPITI
jgi:KUP system potassium uptake protein